MELVVLNIAPSLGLIPPQLFSILVIMALVSTLITSLTCRIIALGGDIDPGMDNDAVASWGIHTASSIYYQMLR
ncbi:hypothetical protein ACIPIN_09960 [Pseudomonas sp. NPDC087697]|uniref:hypothetical protein n=1 Tax=Pseudomonas sp. NPDC087697 TaxID=3364447 RepID=UPI0038023FD2